MKQGILALLLALMAAGCSSTGAIVPALDGARRVPVNRHVPAAAPYLAPQADTTQDATTGEQQ